MSLNVSIAESIITDSYARGICCIWRGGTTPVAAASLALILFPITTYKMAMIVVAPEANATPMIRRNWSWSLFSDLLMASLRRSNRGKKIFWEKKISFISFILSFWPKDFFVIQFFYNSLEPIGLSPPLMFYLKVPCQMTG